MTPDLARICKSLGVKVVPNERSRNRSLGETCAERALERIFKKHGAGHLTIVLKSIVETHDNGLQLVAPVMYAVSDIILAYPHWTATTAWLDAMDQANLAQMWTRAKANRRAAKPRCAISTMLFIYLNGIFAAELQGRIV